MYRASQFRSTLVVSYRGILMHNWLVRELIGLDEAVYPATMSDSIKFNAQYDRVSA